MEEKRKIIGSKREFLNLDPTISLRASIGYYIELVSYERPVPEDVFDNYSIEFLISDCSRTISLDFGIQSKEDMANSLHKLETIIQVCQEMQENLKIARKEYLTSKKRRDELKAAEAAASKKK